MRLFLRALLGATVIGVTLVAAGSADIIKDNIAGALAPGQKSVVQPGGTVDYLYWSQATGGSCDAADGSPVPVTIDPPAGVTANPLSFALHACGDQSGQIVTFTLSLDAVPGTKYTIPNVTAADAAGSYSTGNTAFFIETGAPPPPPPAAPTVSYLIDPASPDGANGWYVNTPVTVTWTVTPSLATLIGCDNKHLTHSGVFGPFSCSATNISGSASDATPEIKIDKAPPTISVGLSPAAPNGSNGWYTSPVTASFTCDDQALLSGLDLAGSSCADQAFSTDGTGFQASGTAKDNAGNTASASSVVFKIDQTAPTISVALSPAAPNGDNGWYTSPVTASFTCGDVTSGLDLGWTGCADQTFSTDGTGLQANGSAKDNAGNSTPISSGTFKLDGTAPTVLGSYAGPLNTGTVLTCSVSDNLSGVVGSASYTELYGYGLGTFTGDNCPAPKDNAGNVGNQYLFGPLTVNTYCTGANFKINPPIDSDGAQLSRGKTVPVKFGGLCGDESRASGFDTTGWTIATEKVNCTTHADIASYATPSGTNAKYFRYDQSADQYIYNADFHSGPYAVGDCLQVRVNIGGGAPTLASRYFKLVK